MLKYVIERLIRRGYFCHFIEVVENACNDERREHNRQSESLRGGQRAAPREKIRKILVIFGEPHIAGSLRHTQDKYAREACTGPSITMNRMEERFNKAARRECKDITFIERDTH